MSNKSGSRGQTLSLDDLDQAAAARLMELLPLVDRKIGSDQAKLFIGARGNSVSGVRMDRQREKAWVMLEVEIALDLSE